MDDFENRRKFKRFEVADSTAVEGDYIDAEDMAAQVKHGGLCGSLLGYSKTRFRILNFSMGGLAFESEKPFKQGETVSLRCYLPDTETSVELKGIVRWQKDVLSKYVLVTVGIEFLPFGNESGMNAPEARDVLQALEQKYGHH